MSYKLREYHGPVQRIEPVERVIDSWYSFKVGDVVVTRGGDGSNPAIIRKIIEISPGRYLAPGEHMLPPFSTGSATVFAEVEEIRSGRVVTTIPGEDFLVVVSPLLALAACDEDRRRRQSSH